MEQRKTDPYKAEQQGRKLTSGSDICNTKRASNASRVLAAKQGSPQPFPFNMMLTSKRNLTTKKKKKKKQQQQPNAQQTSTEKKKIEEERKYTREDKEQEET